MKKTKIFIACDTTNLVKVKKIINQSKTNKIKIGYKFGLEFMNSKNGRTFLAKLRKKIIFVDLKLNDTVNTMQSAVKALKDKGAKDVYVYITHAVLSGEAVNKIEKSQIKKLITTDTIDNSKKIRNSKKIEIVSIAPMISEAMKRIANSTSVSSLFK